MSHTLPMLRIMLRIAACLSRNSNSRWRPTFWLTILLLGVLPGCFLDSRAEGAAWTLRSPRWTDKDEAVYEQFVAGLGNSGFTNLNKFIRDPRVNPLYGEEDKGFRMYADCADLPYLLRSYVAYKLRLPFSYVCSISSRGGDQRYGHGIKPGAFKDIDSFSSPQGLFSQVTLVNSGFFRMAPEIQNSDHYPVKIQRNSIKPGTIYYDPNGHVAVVYQVTPDGRIRLIDAHPDRTISRPWFGAKFALGSKAKGGGFKRWRPIWYSTSGHTLRLENRNIPDFSSSDQYQKSYSLGNRAGLSYYDYVRARLSDFGGRIRPLPDFQAMLEDLHEDVKYRAVAVQVCLDRGIHHKPHPGTLPWNIYGTDGLWEEFSTPSRDARLKVAFQEFHSRTLQMIRMAEEHHPALEYPGDVRQLAAHLLQTYDRLVPSLMITYVNSSGKPVSLNFHQVAHRLFNLSFDPYHAPEYRWGAAGGELSTAPKDSLKERMYQQEYRLRNQLERLYNQPTPFSLGPARSAPVDVRSWLVAYLEGRSKPIQPPTEKTHSLHGNVANRPLQGSVVRRTIDLGPPSSHRRGSPEEAESQIWRFADALLVEIEKVPAELSRGLPPMRETTHQPRFAANLDPVEARTAGFPSQSRTDSQDAVISVPAALKKVALPADTKPTGDIKP